MSHELILAGNFVYGDSFEDRTGYIVIESDRIKEIGSDRAVDSAIEGFIIPSFVNAHTHIGDSIAKEPIFMPLERLVGPGGLKERILAQTPHEVQIEAMKETIIDMAGCGIQLFCDFREGGLAGVNMLNTALNDARVRAKVLGRPADDDAGIEDLLESADGLGISSTADCNCDELAEMVAKARSMGKMFAIHAGERNTGDIESAIELEPDFMVHLTKASRRHFRQMYDRGINAVICLRSNLVTGMGMPPVQQMLEAGLTVGSGTDNVMLNSPDMFREMEFISKLLRIGEHEVLKMCTWNSAKVLGEEDTGVIEEGKKANLLVIRADTPNMRHITNWVKGTVRRATRADIYGILYEGELQLRTELPGF